LAVDLADPAAAAPRYAGSAAARAHGVNLLEREAFMSMLGDALKESRTSGRIALISGEAGIGKTSLVDRFAAAADGSTRVLWGACDSLLTPQPLGPLHDIAASLPGGFAERLRAGARPIEIFAAFLAFLREAPSLVIIEDAHWADAATLDFMKFMGRRIHQVPALLVLTFRDVIGPSDPLRVLLGDLATARSVTRIMLPPLSAAAVRKLAGDRIDAVALHNQTGGNPFFVAEVLASGGEMPATVRDAVLSRVARLSQGARDALETAAVIGARTELALLAACGARQGAVDECVAGGLLRSQDDAVLFGHELARQAVLGAIAPQRLRAIHAGALGALRALPGVDPARVAHHADAAAEAAAVREWAPRAARAAAAAGAHREAAAQYARALRYAAETERAPLLEACAEERALIDDLDGAIEARREALALRRAAGDRRMEGDNLARLSALLVRSGRNAEAEESCRRALATLKRLPASRQLAAAYRNHAGLRMLDRDSAEAVRWGRKAIALARKFDDVETVAAGHMIVGASMLLADDARGGAELERSRAIAQPAGLDSLVAFGLLNRGSALGEMFHLAAADRSLAEGIAYAAERDLDSAHHYMLAWQALLRLYQGRWAEAGDIAGGVVRRPAASAIARIMALAALGRLRTRRGDPDAAGPLDEALKVAAQTQTLQRLGPVRAARAEAAWLAGDRARTRVEARAVQDLALRHRHPWFSGELAFWRAKAGERVALPRWLAQPFVLEIKGKWRAAAAAWEKLGCPYERARALGDGDEAAQLAALEIFDRLGARPAADALRRRLRDRGVARVPRGPRPVTRANPFGLTGRELDILGCVASGLSNAAIAARLRISPKTVDHHVSAVLAKLEVSSRAAAARLARERGLLREHGERQAPK
jgi:DNA-binding CsgD family transcriptional regulator